MTKLSSKILALIIALCFTLTFITGCNGDENVEENGPTSPTTSETNSINVFLADEYELVVNDNFQLFYRGVVQAVNPYNYDISVTCSAKADSSDTAKKTFAKRFC